MDIHLTRGFSLLAYPAEYGNSGVMSFQVNQSGIVCQANLGLDTAAKAGRPCRPMTEGRIGPS
jgi:hypothetical protein